MMEDNSIITPFKVTECSWCDETFDIDNSTDHACFCDQIFYLRCLEKDCNQRVWPDKSKLQRHIVQSLNFNHICTYQCA